MVDGPANSNESGLPTGETATRAPSGPGPKEAGNLFLELAVGTPGIFRPVLTHVRDGTRGRTEEKKTIKKWSSRQRRRPDEQSPRADYGLDLGDKVDIHAVVKLPKLWPGHLASSATWKKKSS